MVDIPFERGVAPSSDAELLALANRVVAGLESNPVDMKIWATKLALASSQFND